MYKAFNSILKMLRLYSSVEMNHNLIVRENMLTVMRIYWVIYWSSGDQQLSSSITQTNTKGQTQ